MNLVIDSPQWFERCGIPLLEAVKDNQLVSPDDNRRRASVTLEEGRILAGVAAGRRVLEIGTGLGVSAWCMAETAKYVVTIDPDPWVYENVKTPGNVIRLHEIAQARMWGPYEVAFIDGLHDYGSVKRDIEDAVALLDGHRGVLVFHDYSQDDVKKAVDEASPRFQRFATLPTCGKLTFGVIG